MKMAKVSLSEELRYELVNLQAVRDCIALLELPLYGDLTAPSGRRDRVLASGIAML